MKNGSLLSSEEANHLPPGSKKVSPAELASEARRVVLGDLSTEATVKQRACLVKKWLKMGQSENPQDRRLWALLALEEGIDRDRWVLDLWRSIVDKDGKNRFAKDILEKSIHWSFYQRRFFSWFLGRFDVQAARSIFIEPRQATRLHALLVALLVTVPWLSLGLGSRYLTPSLMVFLGLLVIVALVGAYAKWTGLPWYAYLNSLSPRLAAAVGIGYLFFFSAPHLIKILNDTWRPWWQLWLGVAALVSAAFVYLAFHISRRVHPQLKKRDLFRRSGAILALALAYSSLGLLIAGPMLFSQTFLSAAAGGQPFTVQADVHRLAFCAAIALNLGVILQLAWDEKPLTEPL